MTIAEFAATHRMKTRREDEMTVIVGKSGQLYEYSDGELGVLFITTGTKAPRTHMWRKMSSGLRRGRHGAASGWGC